MRPRIRQCLGVAAKAFDVTPAEVLDRDGHQTVARARHIGMWLARRTTGCSCQQIAMAFHRHPSAIHKMVRRLERLWQADAELDGVMTRLLRELSP